MPRKTYTEEFRSHLVSLVRAGRSPESLSREFEPSAPTIREWVEAADRAAANAPPIDKDARIRELEKQVAILEEERTILKKAAAWFAAESGSTPRRSSRS